MNEKQKKLVALLKEMFQFDQADLNFGIYRIMNMKRDEINTYLLDKLPKQISDGIATLRSLETEAKTKEIQSQIDGIKAGSLPQDVKDQAILNLTKQLEALKGVNAEDLEADVYNRLIDFFSRYYDEGDFISKRRYKDGAYAIPYEGEEVKLYWANSDQYYVKTAEYFNDYSFVTKFGKTVLFKIIEVETERDNNKANVKRFFVLHEPKHFEIVDGKLTIFVEYREADVKKQEEASKIVFDTLKAEITDYEFASLFVAPNSKEKSSFETHWFRYTAKNTYDYFIHKDLGKFLRRELDFYIKNEVLLLDDIQVNDMEKTKAQLVKAQVIREVASNIITFLAQIEDFQKKMYLKKKLVVSTNYCITLDRIPEELYPEITTNDAQREEWVKLFAIDEIKSTDGTLVDAARTGYTNPLTVEFLKQNPFLVLDTAFFSDAFKERLIQSQQMLDDSLDGLLISGDNFQSLRFLRARYKNQIAGIYTDPPYNTNASEIIYKNGYKSSSWTSMMNERILSAIPLLSPSAISCYTIDDFELNCLQFILDQNYSKDNYLATAVIRNNPSGRSTVKGFSINHEYGLFYASSEASLLGKLPHSEEQQGRYTEQDDKGFFEWENFRKNGTDSDRPDRPKQFFPIYVDKKTLTIRVPQLAWDDINNEYVIQEEPLEKEIVLWPVIDGVEKVWKFGVERTRIEATELKVKQVSASTFEIYRKKYLNEEGSLPRTWWEKPGYSARDNGTRWLTDLFGPVKQFDFPKAPEAVMDSIRILNIPENGIVLDFFAGSATTAHAIFQLKRADGKRRKFILCEMGEYFDKVTRARATKLIYSSKWKDSKPQLLDGLSAAFKYLKLESFDDSLSNISFTDKLAFLPNEIKGDYVLKYMLESEANASIFNADKLAHPFGYTMNITRQQETTLTRIDLIETFNYLIGLIVESSMARETFGASFEELETGALKASISEGIDYSTKMVLGHLLNGKKVLIVWRDLSGDIVKDNAVLEAVLEQKGIDIEKFDLVYVNGDTTLKNTGGNKVFLIEEEMQKRMFED